MDFPDLTKAKVLNITRIIAVLVGFLAVFSVTIGWVGGEGFDIWAMNTAIWCWIAYRHIN